LLRFFSSGNAARCDDEVLHLQTNDFRVPAGFARFVTTFIKSIQKTGT